MYICQRDILTLKSSEFRVDVILSDPSVKERNSRFTLLVKKC